MMRTRRMWQWLGTPAANATIAVLMVAYLGLLGLLTYGQTRIVACQARYAEASARSTQARAQIAAEDRQLDLRERALDDADRQSAARSEAAWDAVLTALAKQDDEAAQATFANLIKVRGEAMRQRQESAAQRAEIARTRQANEARRARTPVPPPPSSRC